MKKAVLIMLFMPLLSLAQVGINTTTPNAMLDIDSDEHGILIPRVALLSASDATTVVNPQGGALEISTLIYNTATASGVIPGFYYWNGTLWVPIGGGAGNSEFVSTGGIVRNTTDLVNDHFVFGSTSLDDITGTADDRRMFFNKAKGAFRAGRAENTQWDDANVGNYSVAFGSNTRASGEYATAFGLGAIASGSRSTAFGVNNTAGSMYETVFGLYAVNAGGNPTSYVAADRLFTIGNGLSSANRRNALTIFKNNNLVVGSSQLDDITGETHDNSRMFFNKERGAFRAGNVTGTQWDDANVGDYSVAFGRENRASGDYSVAFGDSNTASGEQSMAWGNNGLASGAAATVWGESNMADGSFATAWGQGTEATQESATAFGSSNTASGYAATAFGVANTALGGHSTAWGWNNTSGSFTETVLGAYTTNAGGNPDNWVATDRLFAIGNGTDNANRSDAFSILKNGLARLPATTIAMIDAADGRAVVTKEWVEDNIGGGNGEFQSIEGIVQNTTNTAYDHFVFGSTSLDDIAGIDDDRRMFFNKAKGAFRAGTSTVDLWDNVNVGYNSVAFGLNTTASQSNSAAFGLETTASGYDSVAFGQYTTASGEQSAAFGLNTQATEIASTAFGSNTQAIGSNSTAFGNNTTASQNASTAFGLATTASGELSTAFGQNNTATYLQTVFGRFAVTGGNNTSWIDTDRLFAIGNGADASNRRNAVTLFKNGNLVVGSSQLDDITGQTHDNSRMFFNKAKGAFRAGTATGTQWNDANVGEGSIALGHNNIASGIYSAVLGYDSVASGGAAVAWGGHCASEGLYSTAFGWETTASSGVSTAFGWLTTANGEVATAFGYGTLSSGHSSTAFGYETTASGDYSTTFGRGNTASQVRTTAWGNNNTASGVASTAWGDSNTAGSLLETVLGRFAVNAGGNPTIWLATDRLFVIGNGSSNAARSNALTILKNGRMGLQTVTAPTYALQLPNSATNGIGRAQANQWDTYSDGRVKTNRTVLPYGLKEILQIEPLAYFHHNSEVKDGVLEIKETGAGQIGFIAQDIYDIIPEIVGVPEDETTELWGISYDKLTPVLVKAIQEQQEIIDAQNQEINSLKEQLARIDMLEARLNEMSGLSGE